MYLGTNFNPIYWSTACLQVNSGSLDGGSTKYDKIAKAIGDIQTSGVKISLIDINNSQYMFSPDIENNSILYGLQALVGINNDIVTQVINKRPYSSIEDFKEKNSNIDKTSMITLIKSGAFNQFQDRKSLMADYLKTTADLKKRITMQNARGLAREGILSKYQLGREGAIIELDSNIKKRYPPFKYENETYYAVGYGELDVIIPEMDTIFHSEKNIYAIQKHNWEILVDEAKIKVRALVDKNKALLLKELNEILFQREWDKYASGNLSKWEMDSLCFYYGEHELQEAYNSSQVRKKYQLISFQDLPYDPIASYSFTTKEGFDIDMYDLQRIMGTCIAKNKNKSTVSILTEDGVVDVKFSRDFFSMYDKRISRPREDGTKEIVEESWFKRGEKILVLGMRRGDSFIAKKYKKNTGHRLYKIVGLNDNNDLILQGERAEGE